MAGVLNAAHKLGGLSGQFWGRTVAFQPQLHQDQTRRATARVDKVTKK